MDRRGEEGLSSVEDRCENYAMLSRLFRSEVDSELLADLVSSPELEPTGNRLFDEGYALLRSWLESVSDVAQGKSALAIDYCLAFLGYGVDPGRADETGANAAYPYESVYRSCTKSLGGEHCAEVSAVYRASGFMPQKDRLIAEDHMACELEFMQHLVSGELDALREGDGRAANEARVRQADFLRNHLLLWAESFAEAVDAFAETDFYRGLSRMTCGWLQMEADALSLVRREREGALL